MQGMCVSEKRFVSDNYLPNVGLHTVVFWVLGGTEVHVLLVSDYKGKN